ncbi:MAG TPA: hypothetical protein VG826_29215 [Pirellulales bacterium]|nr:hypothetical protein [Pirellulales bacterium]
MSVRSGQSITVLFTTRVFATGVGTDADSTPTGTLYVNGTANAATVTVTHISTGLYKAAVTLPTLAIGDEVELLIAATVSSISDSAVVWADTKDLAIDSSGGAAVSVGTGTGQINLSSGKAPATLASTDVTGNVPADAKAINAVSTSSVTTVNANLGTTQPVGFTGTGASALVKGDATDIGGTTAASATIGTVTNLTNAGPDTSGTTTLLSRLSAARAGFLDNLNVGGAVASHADVVAINQSASKHLLLVTVGQYEPGETYTIEMRTFAAADGSAVNADTTPTLTATGQVSGSLSGNLSAAANPATGVYRWTYTPGSSPTLEQIRFDGWATISSATFTLSAYAQTVDLPTAVFTSTDQAHLTAIYDKLPSNNLADETLLLAAIGTPMQAGTAVELSATQPNYLPAKAGDAMALTSGERTSLSTALLDLADAIETGITLRQSHRALLAALCGKITSAGSNPEVFQNPAGTANRISVANDSAGNRTAVSLTL